MTFICFVPGETEFVKPM